MVNRMPVPLITEMEHKEEDVLPFDYPDLNMLTPSRRRSSAMSQTRILTKNSENLKWPKGSAMLTKDCYMLFPNISILKQ